MLGQFSGGAVYSQADSASDFGDYLCPNADVLDVGGLGQSMMGMVGGSVFAMQHGQEFKSAYDDCVENQRMNDGNPSDQLSDGGSDSQGGQSDKPKPGCKKGESDAACEARLLEEKRKAQEKKEKARQRRDDSEKRLKIDGKS